MSVRFSPSCLPDEALYHKGLDIFCLASSVFFLKIILVVVFSSSVTA